MLYIYFVVTFVSSVSAAPKKTPSGPITAETCVYEKDGCNSCHDNWKKRFKEIFEVQCVTKKGEKRVDLVYHGWVTHLIDLFVYGIWIDSNRVRIFKVERKEDCSDIGVAAVAMLHQINNLNRGRWQPLDTCTMFTDKWKFACKPYREKEQWGVWFFTFTTSTTKHVVLCAFTGMDGVSPITDDKWAKLEICKKNWRDRNCM